MGEMKEPDILQSLSHTQPERSLRLNKAQDHFQRLKGGESRGAYQGNDNP